MNEFDDIARELHATRAEPSPEFARELDHRAAEWLREPRRRSWPSMRIALPALAGAAAAVVIALVVSGGDGGDAQLEVAVVPDKGAVEALGGGGEAAPAAPETLERDSAAPAQGGLSAPKSARVEEDEPVTVRYFFTAATEGTVEFAGRESEVDIAAGSGQLEISTEGLPTGRHVLEITVPASPPYRERIEISG